MLNQITNAGRDGLWFAVVADDGYMYTNSVALISMALESWVNPTVMPMPNREIAEQYAVCAYCNRFYQRNYKYGYNPKLPINLLANTPYKDVEYEAREGNRDKMLPFPGLTV